MKTTAFLLLAMVCGAAAADTFKMPVHEGSIKVRDGKYVKYSITRAEDDDSKAVAVAPTAPGQVPCKICVSAADQFLQQLLNYILNVGVVGGCAGLCGILPNQVEAEVCNLLCDIAGIEGFVRAIQAADLDPIYYCQVLKACPAEDCPSSNPDCVTIDGLNVAPPSGSLEDTFTGTATFTVTAPVGTSTVMFAINPPAGSESDPLGTSQMLPSIDTGRYNLGFEVQPADINSQEESAGNPDFFDVGQTYEILFALCEGECGSHHPHSQVFGVVTGNMTIATQDKKVSQARRMLN